MDTQLLPPVVLRSAGLTTSILQDTGITVIASNVTVSLRALLSCQKKKSSRESLGKACEHTVFSNYDATRISAAAESEPAPYLTPEK